MLLRLTTLFLTLLLAMAAGAKDKPFPGINKLMSSEEFSAAGLEQLTPTQLQALDAWLLRYTAGESAILRQDNPEVRAASKDFELISRISGDFRGWSGETVFQLENGQVWRQRLQGRYYYSGPPNPEVRITRNFMGFYRLTLVADDRSVGVSLAQ